MKVFISSVVKGFEHFRAAVKDAVETLDMKPIMSEHFGARTYSEEGRFWAKPQMIGRGSVEVAI
ncbi:DUF4062 domain-containing protein [Pseudomonas caricapapayae]|uniref:DUF4062 domain-containing protein n=1 Tax=Pseudomonas caricapapayae TaxID=46678 RepID=UPI001CC20495|nr:DUF4062 domain-containing protein [Pseudomonas caricapapayae]